MCESNFKTTHLLTFKAGDTETVFLNLRDSNGDVINVPLGTVPLLGIKKSIGDYEFIIPQKVGVISTYTEDTPYTLAFSFSSSDTQDLLYYDNKKRNKVEYVYDVELDESGSITTIVSGEIFISRSVTGVV